MEREIADRLKEARKRKGISQADAARLIGITKSSMSLYETGNCFPHAGTVKKLAELYDVSADYLLCLSDFPFTPKAYCEEYAKSMLKALEKIQEIVKPFTEA